MILVVGATGSLGGAIVELLLKRGERVRALVRPGRSFDRAGVEIALGDMKDRSSLDAACRGVEIVITTANSSQRGGDDTAESVDHQGNIALIDAARDAGVQQFIFVSASAAADPQSPVPLFAAKAKAEAHLRSSGMTWTVIAPHVFMDVWFPNVIGSALRAGRPVALVAGGRTRHSFIAADDVAAFTVAAVRHPAARNQRLLLGGPEALSWSDVVSKAGEILGRALPTESITPGQPIPTLPPPLDHIVGGLMAGLEQQDVVLDTKDLARTFDVQLTPAETVLRKVL